MAVKLERYIKPPGEYYGIDIAETLIEEAKGKIIASNFKFAIIDSPELPFQNDYFDFIVLFSVFTHLYHEDIIQLLREIRRVLRDSGICISSIIADPDIKECEGNIAKMRHNVDFLKKIIGQQGLIVKSVQQSWHSGSIEDATIIKRDQDGCQTCLVFSRITKSLGGQIDSLRRFGRGVNGHSLAKLGLSVWGSENSLLLDSYTVRD